LDPRSAGSNEAVDQSKDVASGRGGARGADQVGVLDDRDPRPAATEHEGVLGYAIELRLD
jgi:hypothetical protein